MSLWDNKQLLGGNFPYTRFTLDTFIRSMQKLDISQIEFYAASPHLYVEDATVREVNAIHKKLSAAGISVMCFTAEQCNYPFSLSSADKKVRSRSIRYYEKALTCAARMQSPKMQMISGVALLEQSKEEAFSIAQDSIAHIVHLAESEGITIVLEADPNCSVSNTDDQIRMIEKIGSPNLTGMIDTNTLALNGENFSDALDKLGEHVQHFHFIDIDITGQRFCLVPGEGTLPMAHYIQILSELGYRHTLTPELWGNTYLNEPEEATERSFTWLRKHLA